MEAGKFEKEKNKAKKGCGGRSEWPAFRAGLEQEWRVDVAYLEEAEDHSLEMTQEQLY